MTRALRRFRGVRAHLLLLIAAALLPVLGLTLYGAERSRAREVGAAADRLLQAAELIAAEQAQVVESARQLLTAMATAPGLVTEDRRACLAYLAKVTRAYDRYLEFVRLDGRGRPTCASTPLVAPGLDLSDRDFFQEVLQSGGFAVGRYTTAPTTGAPILPLAHPILGDEDGAIAGVLVAALRLDWLDRRIEAARLPAAASLLMLGPRGTVLAGRPYGPEVIGSTVPWWAPAAVPSPVPRVFEAGGELVALARTGAGGLTVAVGLPRQQIEAASRRLFRLQAGAGAAVLLAAAGAAWTFGEVVIARRVRRLAAVAGRLEAGDLAARYGGDPGGGELDWLGWTFDRMAAALQRRVVDLREREALFRHQSLHDPLTGLANRRAFEQDLADRLEAARRAAGRTAVLLIDLDGFKRVNDTLGHDVGDALLVAAAGRLRGCVRQTDLVARLGGDEFAVVMTAAAEEGAPEPEEVARRALAAFGAPFRIEGRRVYLGASAGLAVAASAAADEAAAEGARALVKRADTALYAAKAAGRGTYRLAELPVPAPPTPYREGDGGPTSGTENPLPLAAAATAAVVTALGPRRPGADAA